MNDCLFCRIAAGEISARVLFSDDEMVAFYDIAPQAPVHVLVVPRRHIVSLAGTCEADRALLGHLLLGCAEAAHRAGLGTEGFRVVANSGAQSGQSVFHLHFHVLGGRHMRWPPG
jgi:histidine triad (HIT) family protein